MILHRLAKATTIHPAFDGRPRTLEPGSDLGNRNVVVNDELSNPQTSAWSQSRVSVGHKRAFLAVDIFASPTLNQQGPPLPHTPESQSFNQPPRSVQLVTRQVPYPSQWESRAGPFLTCKCGNCSARCPWSRQTGFSTGWHGSVLTWMPTGLPAPLLRMCPRGDVFYLG